MVATSLLYTPAASALSCCVRSVKFLLAIAVLKYCAYIAPNAAGNMMAMACMPSGDGSNLMLAYFTCAWEAKNDAHDARPPA
eukprot:4391024-Prymnesium_polylepis.1